MSKKKTSVNAIYEILKKYSDEEHILTQKKISQYLLDEYNLELDRKTVCRNINALKDFGYDISVYDENKIGYYLRERQFEKGEIFLLANAVYSSPYIQSSYSKDLIKKLLETQSVYYQKDNQNMAYVDNTHKRENDDFFLNIEVLAEAIKDKKGISFDYYEYDLNKNLVKRREDPYYLSPYYLVYTREKTYVLGKGIHYGGLTHYRVDKMKDIVLSELEYEENTQDIDPNDYVNKRIYMYSGEETEVKMICNKAILDNILDAFGKDIEIKEMDDSHFEATVFSTEQGIIYMAQQYLGHMVVVEPESLKKKIKKQLREGLKKYD